MPKISWGLSRERFSEPAHRYADYKLFVSGCLFRFFCLTLRFLATRFLLSSSGLGCAFLASFLCFQLARIIDQLNDGNFSIIANAITKLQDTRIATRSIFITYAEFTEETFQRRDSSSALSSDHSSFACEG